MVSMIISRIYIILLDVCNITPWLTPPFQLISGFFHVNQGVCVAEQASSRGVLEGGGGGGGGATGLLNKGGPGGS